MDKTFVSDPNDRVTETVFDNGNMLGFRLPHSLSNISKKQIWFHFKDFIERAWKNYFDIRHENF